METNNQDQDPIVGTQSYLPTQRYLPNLHGEVYWNYTEASPNSKQALRRKQDLLDSPGGKKPIPPPKSIFSSIRLKGRLPKVPDDSEAIQLLDDLKVEYVEGQHEDAADDKATVVEMSVPFLAIT
jgi:hypothetical protein